jgi:hypothetical protein
MSVPPPSNATGVPVSNVLASGIPLNSLPKNRYANQQYPDTTDFAVDEFKRAGLFAANGARVAVVLIILCSVLILGAMVCSIITRIYTKKTRETYCGVYDSAEDREKCNKEFKPTETASRIGLGLSLFAFIVLFFVIFPLSMREMSALRKATDLSKFYET